MPKKDHAEIAVIIDRSGSMNGMEEVVTKGFNTFLWQQVCAHGTANMTMVLFDDEYELLYSREPINSVKALDTTVYYARGGTALYDALGKTIKELDAQIKKMKDHEKPEHVVVGITTDGNENDSMDWDAAMIQNLIEEKRAEGWEFIFMSTLDDEEPKQLGFKPNEIEVFEADEDGTYDSYLSMSTKFLESRGGGHV